MSLSYGYVTHDSINLHYITNSNYPFGSNVPHLILLHSMNGSSLDFICIIKLLSPYFKLLAVDLRGRGQSSTPEGPENYTLDKRLDDVRHIIKSFNIYNPIIVGLSNGGTLGLYFAIKYPQEIYKLIVLAPPIISYSVPESLRVYIGDSKWKSDLEDILLSDKCFSQCTNSQSYNTLNSPLCSSYNSIKKIIAYNAANSSNRGYADAIYGTNGYDLSNDVRSINIPTMIIHGCDDEDQPVINSIFLRSQIPNSYFVELRGVGHLSTLTSPKRVSNEIYKFIMNISDCDPCLLETI